MGKKEETTEENSVYMESDADAGRSDRYDRSLFFKVLLKVAERGDADAMGQVAIVYLNGDEYRGIEPDSEKAVYWFRKQAEAGSPTGCFNLAIQYMKGDGIEQSFEQALYWMKKAEEKGDKDAPYHISVCSEILDLQKKALAGDMAAMAGLAKKYMELGQNMENLGDSQGENFYKKSFELATEAGKAGEATAQWLLALAYLHGRGVGEDREKALEYYKRGAELGDAACQQDLGCFYANGDGVEEDEEKAFELFKKSAEQGYGLAMQNLGRCYQYGIGCEESLKAAAEWYTKAAEALGDPELAQRAMMFRMMGGLIPEEDEE